MECTFLEQSNLQASFYSFSADTVTTLPSKTWLSCASACPKMEMTSQTAFPFGSEKPPVTQQPPAYGTPGPGYVGPTPGPGAPGYAPPPPPPGYDGQAGPGFDGPQMQQPGFGAPPQNMGAQAVYVPVRIFVGKLAIYLNNLSQKFSYHLDALLDCNISAWLTSSKSSSR